MLLLLLAGRAMRVLHTTRLLDFACCPLVSVLSHLLLLYLANRIGLFQQLISFLKFQDGLLILSKGIVCLAQIKQPAEISFQGIYLIMRKSSMRIQKSVGVVCYAFFPSVIYYSKCIP
jgi:hypothetical protein